MENPFHDQKDLAVRENRERERFIERDIVDRVLEKCTDSQWKLMVALARYGGLRCPSEILGMTWADILWAENRMVVRSPKTNRYKGKASRVVPIFPEWRPHLETAFDQADEGRSTW